MYKPTYISVTCKLWRFIYNFMSYFTYSVALRAFPSAAIDITELKVTGSSLLGCSLSLIFLFVVILCLAYYSRYFNSCHNFSTFDNRPKSIFSYQYSMIVHITIRKDFHFCVKIDFGCFHDRRGDSIDQHDLDFLSVGM